MRRTFLTYVLALFSVLLFAQNENPYSQFGYEAPIMKNQDSNKDLVTRLVIINADTTTEVGWIEVDVASHTIFGFSRDGEQYFQDSLPITILTRWLTTDPANQYHSPYIGMGNDPINGVDPDGARKVYYNADGSYSHTTNNNFFHNLFAGNKIYIENANGYGYTNVSYAAFDNWQSDIFPQGWGARAVDWQFTPKGNEINPVDGSVLGGGALQPSFVGDLIAFAPLGLLKAGLSAPAASASNAYARYGFKALNSIDDVKGVSGLYIFDDATRKMMPYVGKSNASIATRLSVHNSAGRIGGQIYYKPVLGNATALEVQETIMINNLGGVHGTANLRLPVSVVRNQSLNLGITNYH